MKLRTSRKCIQKIKLTNAYYQGYNPEMGYFYYGIKHVEIDGVAIHDFNLFYRWMWKVGGVKDLRIQKYTTETLPIYDMNFYKKEYSLQEHHLSLARLEWRDDLFGADVRVVDFIRRNFRKKRLFHTLDHPTIHLIKEEARQIMELIDLDPNTLRSVRDPMGFLTFPIYPSTQENLGLEFPCKLIYRYNNVYHTPEEQSKIFDNFYTKVPGEVRDANMKQSLEKKIQFW